MKPRTFLAALLVHLVFAAPALASVTPDQAKALVERALAHIKAVGTERAFLEFNLPDSRFSQGELYVFAYDFDGRIMAMGSNPKMAGRNVIDMKSADNKFIIKEFIDIARGKGDGWYGYKWRNPDTKSIQDANSFIKRIPGTNAFLGCAFYR